MDIPNKALTVGFSLSIKYAKITPNGTSIWTKRTAADASIKSNPEYVILYCKVLAINEATNILFKYPFGIGNHQINNDAAKVNLIPIKRIGGKDSNAGLAITKPKPKKIGTKEAIKVSFKFISMFLIIMINKELVIYSLFKIWIQQK